MAWQLVVFVPDSHLEVFKQALFEQGIGRQGNYQHCAWQVLGQGQFRPTDQARPFIGQADELEQLPEWRVEFYVPDGLRGLAEKALLQAHPYEEPAYYFIQHQ